MMRVTEYVFSLEKNWQRKNRDARLTPWHFGILPLMLGIYAGDLLSVPMAYLSWESPFPTLPQFILWMTLLCPVIGLFLFSRLKIDAAGTRFQRVFWFLHWSMFCLVLGIILGSPMRTETMPEDMSCQVTGVFEDIPPGTKQVTARIVRWTCGGTTADGDFLVRMNLDSDESAWNAGMWFEGCGRFRRYEGAEVPGAFDARRWAQTVSLSGILLRERDDRHRYTALIPIGENTPSIASKLASARRRTFNEMAAHSPQGIAPALVLGSPRAIPDNTRGAFGRVGIAHVLAVSGLHFGIIAGMFQAFFSYMFGFSTWIMRRFGRRRAAMIAMLPALAVYLIFVGAPISAQRALIMLAACRIGRVIGRKGDRMRALSFAGFAILVFDPYALFSISFQLSFAAILGIIWITDFYDRELDVRIRSLNIPKWGQKITAGLAGGLLISIATSLTTGPFILYHFGQLPVLGIVTNLIVIPFVSFVMMPAAIITAVFLMFDLPFAGTIAGWCGALENYFADFTIWFDVHIPLTCLEIAPHIGISLAAAAAAGALLCRLSLKWRRIAVAAAGAVILITGLSAFEINPRLLTRSDDLRMTFIAMGQADSTLIEFPDGHVMLIDAGSELHHPFNAGESRLVPYLKSLGIRRIDTLVLTHADYDHVAAMPYLLRSCEIGEIWYNGRPLPDAPWRIEIDRRNIPLIDAGQMPPFKKIGLSDIEILWPRPDEMIVDDFNENESSIVLRIDHGEFSALFMGDAGIIAEQAMLKFESRLIRPATVLKVGHHGSKSASSEQWISRVSPKYAVFSAGPDNRYRFPHHSVVKRLADHQIKLYGTDRNGSVRMRTDGKRIKIETMH